MCMCLATWVQNRKRCAFRPSESTRDERMPLRSHRRHNTSGGSPTRGQGIQKHTSSGGILCLLLRCRSHEGRLFLLPSSHPMLRPHSKTMPYTRTNQPTPPSPSPARTQRRPPCPLSPAACPPFVSLTRCEEFASEDIERRILAGHPTLAHRLAGESLAGTAGLTPAGKFSSLWW